MPVFSPSVQSNCPVPMTNSIHIVLEKKGLLNPKSCLLYYGKFIQLFWALISATVRQKFAIDNL